MGIILIIIGLVIQRQLYITNMDNAHEDFMKHANMFMLNGNVRLILSLLSIGLIIYGIVTLVS